MSTLKAVKSAQFVPSSLKYLKRVLTSRCNSRPRQLDLSWLDKHDRDSLELKIQKHTTIKERSIRFLQKSSYTSSFTLTYTSSSTTSNEYQSTEQLTRNTAPPKSSKKKAGINRNLGKKRSVNSS
ncbi:hypothetical protein F511_26945 [Dorcoceras hygrometricum]|uniref:Uncharacterized protein n=1 Tax=Dorcoceras hygrometricum TaxID=472368 RepID=A0A2Z7BPQ7_9LAMI|nr:hypothetical protein F511_26945 [Dorcoceras hygrometricum]